MQGYGLDQNSKEFPFFGLEEMWLVVSRFQLLEMHSPCSIEECGKGMKGAKWPLACATDLHRIWILGWDHDEGCFLPYSYCMIPTKGEMMKSVVRAMEGVESLLPRVI